MSRSSQGKKQAQCLLSTWTRNGYQLSFSSQPHVPTLENPANPRGCIMSSSHPQGAGAGSGTGLLPSWQ